MEIKPIQPLFNISGRFLTLIFPVALASGIYIFLSCYNLRVPGANYDEMLYQAPAVTFLADTVRTEPMQINPSVISVLGRPLPLMLMTYIGSIKVLWHILIFFLFGISVETARIGSILLGVPVLIFTYLFVLRIFSQKIAFLAVLLMATSAEFVFYTSRDMTIVFMLLAKMSALFLYIKYLDTSRALYLVSGSFALGLGLYDKASFLWFIFTLLIYVILFHRKRIFLIPFRHSFAGFAGFLSGGIIFFIFNIVRLGETFVPMLLDFHKTSGGVDNTNFLGNLATRIQQWHSLLNGEGLSELFTQTRMDSEYLVPLPWLYTAALIIITTMMLLPSFLRFKRKFFFLLFFFALTMTQTAFTPSSLSLHHVAIVWPFHVIMFAAATVLVARTIKSVFFRTSWLLIPSLAIFLNLASVFALYRHIENHGSAGNWSETIYELNDYLTENKKPVVLMTWGFTNNLIVTSRGYLTMVRVYSDVMKSGTDQSAEIISRSILPGYYYLFSVNQPQYNRLESLFLNLCDTKGVIVKCEKIFFQKNGEMIYKLYIIQPQTQHDYVDQKEKTEGHVSRKPFIF